MTTETNTSNPLKNLAEVAGRVRKWQKAYFAFPKNTLRTNPDKTKALNESKAAEKELDDLLLELGKQDLDQAHTTQLGAFTEKKAPAAHKQTAPAENAEELMTQFEGGLTRLSNKYGISEPSIRFARQTMRKALGLPEPAQETEEAPE